MVQEKHTLEGWKSAVSILQQFLQTVDLAAMTKFTNAAAPQLTALMASGKLCSSCLVVEGHYPDGGMVTHEQLATGSCTKDLNGVAPKRIFISTGKPVWMTSSGWYPATSTAGC